MNWDDESYLSAFLDGELGPGDRLLVESALLSDLRLAGRFRELAQTRDLLASASRPRLPCDLSRQVTDRLPARRARRISPWLRVVGGGLSAAALVFVALTLGMRFGPHGPGRAPNPLVLRSTAPAPPSGPGPARPSTSSVVPVPATVSVLSATRPSSHSDDPAPDRSRTRDELRLRALLDSPDLRKVLFITDKIGGDAERTVGTLVENTARLDSSYGRFTVGQGIVIDPRHPDQAVVFAVVVNDQEFRQLKGDLRSKFEREYEEADPDPAVTTQLADIGQFQVLPGLAVATVENAPERAPHLAIRSDRGAADGGPDLDSGPTPAQELSAPAHAVRSHSPGAPSPSGRVASPPTPRPLPPSSRSSLVLVWVTTRDRRGGGP